MTLAKWVLGLVGAGLVAGCDTGQSASPSASTAENGVEGQVKASRTAGRRVRVWTDPETGCQYLLWGRSSRGSMTPRLKPDGMPICKPVTQTPGGAGGNAAG